MEIIKSRKTQAPAPEQSGTLRNLAVSGATGKEVGPSAGPQMSNIAAQRAAQEGKAQLGQLQLQQQLGQQQLGFQNQMQEQQTLLAEEQQEQQLLQQQKNLMNQETAQSQRLGARADMAAEEMLAREQNQTLQLEKAYSNVLAELASERGIVEQELFSWANQQRGELSLAERRAFIEQTAHSMALADRKYTDQIKQIAQVRDLQDQLNFKKEATFLAFGQNFEILGQQFDMQRLINADAREFQDMIKRMDINTALAMAEQASKESVYKSMLTGAAEIGSGIVQYNRPEPQPQTINVYT